jgi:hypothetical protein
LKISQLIGREDFFKILENTLKENSFFRRIVKTGNESDFSSYNELNIIFNNDYSQDAVFELTSEYKRSKSRAKEIVQKVYVYMVIKSWFRKVLSNRKLKLDSSFKNYAIIGGNHRIRLFDRELEKIYVLLKSGENSKFVRNDIDARFNNSIFYAPKILEYGSDWLIESYIRGTPLNRLDSKTQERATNSIIKTHLNYLLNPTRKKLSLDIYLSAVKKEILDLVELIIKDNPKGHIILKWMIEIEERLLNLGLTSIDVCMTHGDFQLGNIRISESGEPYVLDWEASDTRFYLYDLFVILGGIRTGVSFENSFEGFLKKINGFDKSWVRYSPYFIKAIFSIEELKFNLYEDVSVSYFQQGNKSLKFMESIV